MKKFLVNARLATEASFFQWRFRRSRISYKIGSAEIEDGLSFGTLGKFRVDIAQLWWRHANESQIELVDAPHVDAFRRLLRGDSLEESHPYFRYYLERLSDFDVDARRTYLERMVASFQAGNLPFSILVELRLLSNGRILVVDGAHRASLSCASGLRSIVISPICSYSVLSR